MSILEEIFHPSARHRQEERHRLEWTRDDEGEGDPYRGPIDLDSGIVHIRIRPKAADPASPPPPPARTEPTPTGPRDGPATPDHVRPPPAT